MITLFITDNSADSVDIELQSANVTTATDDDTEGGLIFVPGTATLSLSKSISNIRLSGVLLTKPVPGATITYEVKYSNQGPAAANEVLIYDQLPSITGYYEMAVIPGWTNQFPTAAPPGQAYDSAVYSNAPAGPSFSSNIRWVRWKRPSLAAGQAGTLIYRVIIK